MHICAWQFNLGRLVYSCTFGVDDICVKGNRVDQLEAVGMYLSDLVKTKCISRFVKLTKPPPMLPPRLILRSSRAPFPFHVTYLYLGLMTIVNHRLSSCGSCQEVGKGTVRNFRTRNTLRNKPRHGSGDRDRTRVVMSLRNETTTPSVPLPRIWPWAGLS